MSNALLQEDQVAEGLATYTIDPTHSEVLFKVRHLGLSKVTGFFETFAATLHLDPSDLTTIEAEATIETATVNTRNSQRDAHLRSEDFFESDEYPVMAFKSTAARFKSDEKIELTGELTIRNVTRSVTLDVTFLGEGADPWGGSRVAFEGRTKINRTAYGLVWNQALEAGGFLVGEDVEIVLDLQFVRQ